MKNEIRTGTPYVVTWKSHLFAGDIVTPEVLEPRQDGSIRCFWGNCWGGSWVYINPRVLRPYSGHEIQCQYHRIIHVLLMRYWEDPLYKLVCLFRPANI